MTCILYNTNVYAQFGYVGGAWGAVDFNIAAGWTYSDPNHIEMTDPNDILIIGDTLRANTNTDGFVFMGDGTNYAPEAINLGTDTAGNYCESITTTAPITGGLTAAEGTDHTIAINDVFLYNNATDATTGKFGVNVASPSAQLDIETSGAAVVGLNIDAYAGQTANLFRIRDPNNNNLVIVDDNGDISTNGFLSIGVNVHETISVSGVTKSIQFGVHGDDVANKYGLYVDRASDTHTAKLILARGRGAHSAPTQVADDDVLGLIGFLGWDGTDNDMNKGAKIFARVNGTPGNDDLPTELVFATTADGAASATENMTLDNAGNLVVVGMITATGTLHGKIEIIADDNSLSAAQCYGSLNKLNGAETTTLPAAVAGMNVLLYSDDATVKTIDPNGNDHIWLNGVDLTAGVSINSPGAVGDYIVLVAFADNNWYSVGQSGVWVVTP